MKRQIKFLSCLFLFVFCVSGVCCANEKNARHPFVSGSFYPADKDTLSRTIDNFLSNVPEQKKPEGQIVALILPHAGYVYSGQVAAYGYKLIEGMDFDTVILIGLYHKAAISEASVWREGDWTTPLGAVQIDTKLAEAILKENQAFRFSQDAHLAEHSLEVHIPFLQKVLKNFKIVPIVMSRPSLEMSQLLAEAITKHIKGKKVLIIASTDMSHYHPDAKAKSIDRLTLDLLEKQDSGKLLRESNSGKIELCGIAATLTALKISDLIGNTRLEVLKYATSGDVTGDRSRVVGYSSSVIVKTDGKAEGLSQEQGTETLNTEQKKELLKIARETVETYLTQGRVPEFSVKDPILKEERAVFVTLREFGQLRGCIGRLVAEEPLYLAVRNMTIESATRDPRFRPVRPEELKDLTIEISVLSPPRRIKSADEIQLGTHGVIVRHGLSSGVFLPKVAEETKWDKETFLGELCRQKASLPADCWQDPQTELHVFTSFDFSEASG